METGWIWASRVHSSLNRHDEKMEKDRNRDVAKSEKRKETGQKGKLEQMFKVVRKNMEVQQIDC